MALVVIFHQHYLSIVEYDTTSWDKIGTFYYLPQYGMIYGCCHFKNIWRVLLLFTHIMYLEYGMIQLTVIEYVNLIIYMYV